MQFIVIAPAMFFCFGAVLACCTLSYHKVLLLQASAAIAERTALADVNTVEFDSIADKVLSDLGLRTARWSLETEDAINVVHVSAESVAGIELQAVSFGASEVR